MGFLEKLPSNASLLLGASASLFAWRICLVVYRIYFHPLSKIPGPRLAAASSFYIFWWNAFRPRFYLQIEKLHKIYGPVVRISPNEVHLSNPDNFDLVYGFGSKYTKDADFYKLSGTSAFSTPENHLHRVRRAVLNPFFSRKKALSLEDIVQDRASKLLSRMRKSFEASTPFNVHFGYRALSVDVITDYAFDACFNLLGKEDLGETYFEMLSDFTNVTHWIIQFPKMESFLLNPPEWLKRRMKSAAFLETAANQVLTVKRSMDAGEQPKRATILHDLLNPDNKDVIDQSTEHLVMESSVLLGAASDTVGVTLVRATWDVYGNPEIYEKVLAELTEAFPDPNVKLEFLKLEKLKYLTGIIKEALRLALPVPGRLPRVAQELAEFDGFTVVPGTKVSMSMWLMHRDPTIFPEPERFNPERWLSPDSSRLDKYLVAFGKGARICLGMPDRWSLAYCELYVVLGTIFRKCGKLGLSEMRKEDWEFDDYFIAMWKGRKLSVMKSVED